MQQTLFHKNSGQQAGKKELVIAKSHQKQVLSKQQQAFNRLVKKIEKLQAELKNTATLLDEKLKEYAANIHPLEKDVLALRVDIIKAVFKYYSRKKLFPKKEKDTIKEILALQLENIGGLAEPDAEIKEIFEAIFGMSFEDAAEEGFEDMKDEMEDMFGDFGFDIDLDDFHSKMTPEEMAAKIAEMQAKFKEHASEEQQKEAERPKTKKQLEKEEKIRQVEEAKNKNINTIYRQLAKIFHPDLETDEFKKLEKEELMKQLTVANENNDLHTLLRLELQWIHKEDNDPAKLSDGKLKIYNDVMKEQVEDLEEELFNLENHPRFEPLRKLATFPDDITTVDMRSKKKSMEWVKQDMGRTLSAFTKGEAEAVKEIKSLIRQFNGKPANSEFVDFDEALERLMQMQMGGKGKRR